MSDRDLVLLEDIINFIDKILEDTDGLNLDAFAADSMRVDAVVRNLEIIGEAAKMVSSNAKLELPGIDWKGMAGMRDRLIHAYRTDDDLLVWKTAKERLPQIKGLILSQYSELLV